MKRIVPVLIVLLVLGLGVGTMWFLWSKSKKTPVVAKTETMEKRDIVKKTVATGSIVPREEVELKPRVSGVIDELFLEPGAIVQAGAQVARIRIVPDAAALQRAQSGVQSAKIALANAQRELTRGEGLAAQGVISTAELDTLKNTVALRQEDLNAANGSLTIVKEGAMHQGGAASNVIVTATVSGMITDVPVKKGESVIESNTFNAGTTIATVANMNDMIFDGEVDESEVGKIKEGMDLAIKIGALEKETFDGKLEYIAPKGKLIDGAIQFEIKASIVPKPGVFIRAGYSANADVVLDKRTQVLALREALVQWQDGQPFVEVETAPKQFARRDIKLGLSDGIYAEVLSGLKGDEKIKQPSNAGSPGPGGGRPGMGGGRRRG